jgi:hypothetical protein
MQEAFRLGGWGMYPTALIGIVLVIAAMHYAWHPVRASAVIVRRLAVLTMLSATLGFVSGVIKSFTAAGGNDWQIAKYVVVGVGESMTNLGLGLMLVTLATVFSTVAAFRARTLGVELVDPHP